MMGKIIDRVRQRQVRAAVIRQRAECARRLREIQEMRERAAREAEAQLRVSRGNPFLLMSWGLW